MSDICNCKKTCNINTSCCTTNSCEKKSNCCDKYTELKPLCIESLFNTSECSRYENALSKAKISRNSFFSAKAAVYNYVSDCTKLAGTIKTDISDNKYNLQSIKEQYIALMNTLLASIYSSLNQCHNNKRLINITMAKVNKTTVVKPLRSTALLFVNPNSCKTNILSYIPSVSLELNIITEEVKIKFCEPEYVGSSLKHGTLGKDRDLRKTFILCPPIQNASTMDVSDNNLELLKTFGCTTLDLDIIDSVIDVFDTVSTARSFFDDITNYQDYSKSTTCKLNNNILSVMNYFDKVISSMENSHRYVVQESKINSSCDTTIYKI